MTGTYDQTTNTLYWGTANPAPDYDLARRPMMSMMSLIQINPADVADEIALNRT